MLNENGFEIDMNAVREVLANGDVITVGFATFPERLLVDTRFNQFEGPLSTIVAPVTSVQERYQWLGQHRGMFGAPQGFSFFVWPLTVRNLVERDGLAVLRDRLAAHSEEAAGALDRVLRDLVRHETEAIRELIRGGDAWRTIWTAKPLST